MSALRYSPDIEQPEPDEDDAIDGIIQAMTHQSEIVAERKLNRLSSRRAKEHQPMSESQPTPKTDRYAMLFSPVGIDSLRLANRAAVAPMTRTSANPDGRPTDLRPDMGAFNVPTLVVHGTGDATVPIDPTGRAAAKAIGDSELKEYDGAPHGLTATHASQLNADLLAFLKS